MNHSVFRAASHVLVHTPNQTYINNIIYQQLKTVPQPWYDNAVEGSKDGEFGEILSQLEFYGLLQVCDVFDLVLLKATAKILKDNKFNWGRALIG